MSRAKAIIALMVALAAAGPAGAADLDYVNPELRTVAGAILRAQPSNGMLRRPPRPPPPPPGVIERELLGTPGQPPVPVFVINARSGGAARGAILFIHGGGFVAGDARDNLRALARLAERLDCVIVSVQYRLAPQMPFPGALADNHAALRWLRANAASLGVDPARLVVMGESAGGGHAAMLTIAMRDAGEPPIAAQVLIYPMLDDRTGTTRSVLPTIGTLIWRPADNRRGWTALLGQAPGGAHPPVGAVPARVADLRRLPPTFIGVGSIDLFAEEDIEFGRRLVSAGVPVELLVVPGAFHGFQMIAPQADVSKQFNGAVEAALRRALAGESEP